MQYFQLVELRRLKFRNERNETVYLTDDQFVSHWNLSRSIDEFLSKLEIRPVVEQLLRIFISRPNAMELVRETMINHAEKLRKSRHLIRFLRERRDYSVLFEGLK